MNEPRYTPKDFENTRFAALKNKDGTIDYFLKTHLGYFVRNPVMSRDAHSIYEMIGVGAFPVFPEPYSPEALQFAWEHAEGTEGNPEFVHEGKFEGTSMYMDCNGSISVTSTPRLIHLGSNRRVLHQKPVRKTPAEKIAELLEKEVPGLPEDSIENVSAAIADRADDLIKIFEE